MYNIRPMPQPVMGPRPGIATPSAPAVGGGGIANTIASGGGFAGAAPAVVAPAMANPGAVGRSFAHMAPTMGNHFVAQY